MARRLGTPALAGTARRRRAKRALLFALAAFTFACAPSPEPTWTLDGEAFGTRWTVRIRGPETDAPSVRAAIEAELDAVDRSMSNWRGDSELSRLNASESTDPRPVSEPLALVTLYHAWRERFDKHRRIARWTWPIWMYVSITGVAIYLMLYQM